MKIIIIGGSDLIGSRVTAMLPDKGHQVILTSPNTGVNALTGEGLVELPPDTDVVIDLANPPSFEDKAVRDFFTSAGRNQLAAEKKAGVKHHLAVSIVGVLLMQDSGYMRAKKVQEDLILQSGVPYTLIRSTSFFEFLKGIADQATEGDVARIPDVEFQPVAADDVASLVVETALSPPVNGVVEIAGPDRFTMPEFINRFLERMRDPRKVVPNHQGTYFGARIGNATLVPAGPARIGEILFETWLNSHLT